MPSSADIGRRGERAAARLLERRGWEVVGTGFVARRGEIDLVARDGGRLVLVEVKTRAPGAYAAPVEAVGVRKRRALAAAAAEYRALSEWRGPIAFAIVGLTMNGAGELVAAELFEDLDVSPAGTGVRRGSG